MTGLRCRCPRCGQGPLLRGFLKLRDACPSCGLNYGFADPAVPEAIASLHAPCGIRLSPAEHAAFAGNAIALAEAGGNPVHGAAVVALPGIGARLPGRAEAGYSRLDDDGHVRPIAALEADAIRYACAYYGGRLGEVARRLGIGRSTLYRKVREQGLEDAVKGAGGEESSDTAAA